jgi:regulatory protein
VKSRTDRKHRPPLDLEALERFALSYAERYATTQSKLAAYLRRKVRERGWGGDGEPPIALLVERLAELRYVDDRAFAEARAASLTRRGYGERRVGQALLAAGVSEDDAAPARERMKEEALHAALRFAERRRIGPWAEAPVDRARREKAIAAMLRAGHPLDLARRVVDARPGEVPHSDEG